MTDDKKPHEKSFRPRARLLSLLGEQLIDNARLAVFEMVKNSYDADATEVIVSMNEPNKKNGTISVQDDGSGMGLDILENVWLEPGADMRKEQRSNGIRSPKYNRLPLGEKGVGRFAAHKLGNRISLWTRAKNAPEYHLEINWQEQLENRYMDQTSVTIETTNSAKFSSEETGTFIEIGSLKSIWTRGEVRRLYRNVTSIASPFETQDDFDVTLNVPQQKNWISDIPDVGEILERALWKYEFSFDENGFTWKYSFNPASSMPVSGDKKEDTDERLAITKKTAKFWFGKETKIQTIDFDFLKGIGAVEGEFYIFDQDKEVMSQMQDQTLVSSYLENNGGVRVYRDDIRVYNYGEPGNDWLGLDLRRVNQPTKSISNNNIVGIVSLQMKTSSGLTEKTSRDGFDDNDSYQRLRTTVVAALSHLEGLRSVDKGRLKTAMTAGAKQSRISPNSAINDLRKAAIKRKLDDKFMKIVDKVESRVSEMQDTLLRPGNTNMHVVTLFHEVERGVRALNASIKRGDSIDTLEKRSGNLIELLDNFANFFRKTPQRLTKVSKLVAGVVSLNKDRFLRHEVTLSNSLLTSESKDFQLTVPPNMVMGVISNILDNSIYWLDKKWPPESKVGKRAISISTSDYFEDGPALIFADNGTGYKLSPEDIMTPFVTLKPDGMGIGMYYARLVMEACEAYIAFPSSHDVDLLPAYDGAVTALVFKNAEWLK